MRAHRVAAAAAAVAVAVAGQFVGVAPAAGATSGFTFEAPVLPQVSPSPAVLLNGISCAGNTCAAVGGFIGQAAAEHPLIEMRTGGAWAQVPSANPGGLAGGELTGVSCVSATFCAAVGFSYTGGNFRRHVSLIEQWDGTSWTAVSSPDPGGADGTDLAAVSCPSSTECTAVGSYETPHGSRTLYVGYGGLPTPQWNQVLSPNPFRDNELDGISCLTSIVCTSVGSYTPAGGTKHTLVMSRRARGQMSVVPSPNPGLSNELRAVSCPVATSCVAVGVADGVPLALHWDGTAWTSSPVNDPDTGELDAVTCTAVDACTAVGWEAYSTIVESWDGTAWTRVVSPNTHTYYQLRGVACRSATSCYAAGDWDATRRQLLMLAWNGTAWSRIRPASPSGAHISEVDVLGVSCPIAHFCMAVGYYGPTGPSAQIWTGGAWAATASAPLGIGGFADVSCLSASYCVAVGEHRIESWDGTAWTDMAAPDGYYDGVSCVSASFCVATGGLVGGKLIAMWDGSTWSAVQAVRPGTLDYLNDVSCASATRCAAVGATNDQLSLPIDMWDGTKWTVVDAAPTTAGALQNVSCVGTSCMAVGHRSGGQFFATLAERWTGTVWNVVDSPNPGPAGAVLNGVSCTTPAACTAVGEFDPNAGTTETLALHWDGTQWTQIPSVNGGGNETVLTDVSCTSVGGCTALGHRNSFLLGWTQRMGLIEGDHP